MTIKALDRASRLVTTASSNGNDYVTTTSLEATDDGTLLRMSFDSTPSSLIGRIPMRRYASASSPFEGVISTIPGE